MIDNIIKALVRMIAVSAIGTATVYAETGWLERMLFEPSPQQLELEARGRVMIYRGFKDSQVEDALDRQFERIEHMMFIGTILTDETGSEIKDADTGEVLVEDDGC